MEFSKLIVIGLACIFRDLVKGPGALIESERKTTRHFLYITVCDLIPYFAPYTQKIHAYAQVGNTKVDSGYVYLVKTHSSMTQLKYRSHKQA